jgi:hypothetical protein
LRRAGAFTERKACRKVYSEAGATHTHSDNVEKLKILTAKATKVYEGKKNIITFVIFRALWLIFLPLLP